ncbi:MAG: hypothetical protein ACRDZ4_13155 [Egibacteraceae bacterium]
MARKRKKAEGPNNGQAAPAPEPAVIARPDMIADAAGPPDPEPRPELVPLARELAHLNGLRGQLTMSCALERYPVRGHGFVVTIQEREGAQRSATQRFDAEGKATMWTIDSRGRE